MRSHWTSYFFTGSLAVIASWVVLLTLSGCRFGNAVVYAPPADPYSGYYATQPASILYSASLNTGEIQQSGSTSEIPSLASAIFSNPLTLQLTAAGANTGELYAAPGINGSNLAFPIDFSQGGETLTGNSWADNGQDAWQTDSSCTLQTALVLNANLVPLGKTPSPVTVAGNSLSLNGRLTGAVSVELYVLNSNGGSTCTSALQKISACYQDVSQCDSSSGSLTDNTAIQNTYIQFFGPWILSGGPAGVITAAEIAQITPDVNNGSLVYQIQYE